VHKDFSLSILIPTFNRPNKLKLLLNSIRENNIKELCPYEIRIYDNNSELNYQDTLKSFGDLNIIYKKNSNNLGKEKNFLRLQEDIKMRYFCIISDDDFISNNHIKVLKNLLSSNKNARFGCSHTIIKKNGRYLKSPSMKSNFWLKDCYFKPSNKVIWHMYFNHFVSTGCIFESTILKEITFNQELDDRLFLTELASKYPFCVNHFQTATLLIDSESSSSFGSARKDLDHVDLMRSLTKKIDQAKRLHKENSIKKYYPKNQLFLIYIYEYLKDFLKLFLSSRNDKIEPIPPNFSLSFFGLLSLLFLFRSLKIFLKVILKIKVILNFKK